MTNDTTTYEAEAIQRGYYYECGCGEVYRTIEAARRCRKCRDYLMDLDDADEVIDIRHGGIVWAASINWELELAGALPKWHPYYDEIVDSDTHVDWSEELAGAADKPRTFRATLADVWPRALLAA